MLGPRVHRSAAGKRKPETEEGVMSTIQRVLFPVDFCLRRGTLTSTRRRMFDRRNVEIVLLHALEYPPCSRRGTAVERAMAQMELLERKELGVRRACRRAARG